MAEIIALFLAGLSLFFTGVAGVQTKLQQLSSRQFRQVLGRLTDKPLRAALAGVVFSALTQSAAAVGFIVSGMVATGLLPMRRALPVVAAANVGTALLVFLAAFDVRLAVLYVIGITGLLINFRVAARYESIVGALFAVGLLFFGLDLMKRSVGPLPSYPWFHTVVAFLKEFTLAPFLVGAAMRMFIQSSSAIGLIAIALEHSGLLTVAQAVLLIFGIGPGVALSTYFLSTTLQGVPRQVLIYQGIINAAGGCVLAVIFIIDAATDHNLARAVFPVAPAFGDMLAWAYLASTLAAFLCGLALLPVAEPWLNRLSPPTPAQDMSRPLYINDEALAVPDAALDLAEKEQLRLFSIVLRIIDSVRSEAAESGADNSVLTAAGSDIGRIIEEFLGELIDTDLSAEAGAQLLLLDRRQEHLLMLLKTVGDFTALSASLHGSEHAEALMDRLKESLSFILLAAQDAWSSRDQTDIDVLLKLTSDRGDLLERLRRSVLARGGDAAETSTLSFATSLFERAVWLVRQIGLTLDPQEIEGAAP